MAKLATLATVSIAIALPFMVGLVACWIGPVLARGDNIASFFTGEPTHRESEPSSRPAPSYKQVPEVRRAEVQRGGDRRVEIRRAVARRLAAKTSLGNRAICVRLCDGYFFPLGNVTDLGAIGEQATQCSNLCPAAAARIFLVPPSADTIENAASVADGQLYSALPAAFRYTHVLDQTCTCQNGNQDQLAKLMTDVTLRPGDVVVTPSGLRIFAMGTGPHAAPSLLSYSQVPQPEARAAALIAIDNVVKHYSHASALSAPTPIGAP